MKLPSLAIIGAGNMGEALLRGLLEKGAVSAADVSAAEKLKERADAISSAYGIRVSAEVGDACRGAEICLLAVKPQDVGPALSDLAAAAGGKLLVSVCAGITLERLAQALPEETPIVRVMPNTPALVGCGASVYCANRWVDPARRAWVETLLGAVGEVYSVEKEGLLDAVTGLSGSGPAYVYTFIEALADGGVLAGLPRDLARALACQTVLGAARLVHDSPLHTAELKDRVTSPGGTTAAGLRELELRGFRGAVIEAVRAAAERSRQLGS
ncbi:MAG: pyrroline-5-carboxylate reductase [Deltaproteobacteria bacterium]|nr:pyrroline-5-carboxylate reductase [Deltaproteobacteria bacterium]